jgi:hypothetical protein
MSKLIDAASLLEKFTDEAGMPINGNVKVTVSHVRSLIRQEPYALRETAGRVWDSFYGFWKCTRCGGYEANRSGRFCKWCGAAFLMEEEKK